jgi:hypothetical protein
LHPAILASNPAAAVTLLLPTTVAAVLAALAAIMLLLPAAAVAEEAGTAETIGTLALSSFARSTACSKFGRTSQKPARQQLNTGAQVMGSMMLLTMQHSRSSAVTL